VASLAADWDKRQREALSAVLDRLAMPRKAADALRRKVGG
jgi:hypothetical protein